MLWNFGYFIKKPDEYSGFCIQSDAKQSGRPLDAPTVRIVQAFDRLKWKLWAFSNR